MQAADGKGDPPPELKLAWFCGEHHLPDPGGMYDQDYQLINTMKTLTNVYKTVSRLRTLEGDQINSLSNDERVLLGKLYEWGYLGGGLG